MNGKQTAAALTRERLIKAALVVLEERGVQHLTLDMVAKQAEVSKGGLLHHFPSKDQLIEALIRYLYEQFNARITYHYEQDPEPKGRWTRAYARASFEENMLSLHMLVELFVYVKDDPNVWQILRQDMQQWEERLFNDGIPPEHAVIVRMVCDEYWTEATLRMPSKLSPSILLETLIKLTL